MEAPAEGLEGRPQRTEVLATPSGLMYARARERFHPKNLDRLHATRYSCHSDLSVSGFFIHSRGVQSSPRRMRRSLLLPLWEEACANQPELVCSIVDPVAGCRCALASKHVHHCYRCVARALGISTHELRNCIAENRVGAALLERFREAGIVADNTT
jgi:hypothetical protein